MAPDPSDATETAYNDKDRNCFKFGLTPPVRIMERTLGDD
jgi:hypothetical protein